MPVRNKKIASIRLDEKNFEPTTMNRVLDNIVNNVNSINQRLVESDNTALTASNISNFTRDVRLQLNGSGIISYDPITGIISASATGGGGYVTPAELSASYPTRQEVSGALTPYATLTGVSASFISAVVPSTSGNVLTSNGVNWLSAPIPTPSTVTDADILARTIWRL